MRTYGCSTNAEEGISERRDDRHQKGGDVARVIFAHTLHTCVERRLIHAAYYALRGDDASRYARRFLQSQRHTLRYLHAT